MRITTMMLAVLTALALTAASSHAQTRTDHSYSYVLSFTGRAIPIKSVSGGIVRGEVTEVIGTDGVTRKQVARIVVVPLTFESSLGDTLGDTLRPWVRDSLAEPGTIARNAEVSLIDLDGRQRVLRVLQNAVVSGVSLPALDAASKIPVHVSLELRPQTITTVKGSGAAVQMLKLPSQMMASNFRLEIDGLPANRVIRIEPLTWTLRESETTTVDADRESTRTRPTATIGNLRLYISQVDYEPWVAWHRSFVLEGRSSDKDERSGRLSLLSTDPGDPTAQPLLEVELNGLGILSIDREVRDAATHATSLFAAEMYLERLEIVR